jgi:hypothetical protein
MATKPLKFQLTLYPEDVAAIAALGDALEASGVPVRGPDGTRSKAAVMRYALRTLADWVRWDAELASPGGVERLLREANGARDEEIRKSSKF